MAEGKQRNNALDMLKMISIACVVIIHTIVVDKDFAQGVDPILTAFAVPVFIIISAYLRTKKINKIGVKGAYAPRYMFISFMSLMLGYMIYVIVETLISLLLVHKGIQLNPIFGEKFLSSVPDYLVWLFTGTNSFGSYYIPIMVELIIVFPLIYLLFVKNRYVGLILCIVLNLGYDLLSHFLGMPSTAYRLLIFRYILLIGFGIYLGLQKEFDKKGDITALVLLLIGLAYVILNGYFYQFEIFGDWSTSSMLVAPFAYGYVYFMMKWFGSMKYSKIFVFGKASYHIYLVQMLFFFFYGNEILKGITKSMPEALGIVVMCAISLVVTFGLGVGFYFLETKLRKLLKIAH